MSLYRLAKTLGYTFLDVTAKTGNQAFSPDFREVMLYKRGETSEADYTRIYIHRMRNSYSRGKEEWEKLKQYVDHDVVVACYCAPGAFCHRHIFVDLLEKYLKREGIELVRMGELTKEKK